MRSPRLRAPALLLLLLPTACLSGGGSSPAGGDAGYLGVAVTPGRMFRWTPLQGNEVELYVELHDDFAELPTGFAGSFPPATLAAWVEDAVQTWMGGSGTQYLLDIASHAAGQSQPSERTAIHVRFASSGESQLEGIVTMYTGSTQNLVSRVEMEIHVPSNAAQIAVGAYHRLLRHEFGHALGIIGFQPGSGTSHSPNQGDVMFPVVGSEGLSGADRATFLDLYGRAPNLQRADSVTMPFGADPYPGGLPYSVPGISLLMPIPPLLPIAPLLPATEQVLMRVGCVD